MQVFQVLMLSDGGEVCLDWIDNGHKDGSKVRENFISVF